MLKQSSRSTCTAKTGGPSLFTSKQRGQSVPLRRSPCQGLLDRGLHSRSCSRVRSPSCPEAEAWPRRFGRDKETALRPTDRGAEAARCTAQGRLRARSFQTRRTNRVAYVPAVEGKSRPPADTHSRWRQSSFARERQPRGSPSRSTRSIASSRRRRSAGPSSASARAPALPDRGSRSARRAQPRAGGPIHGDGPANSNRR